MATDTATARPSDTRDRLLDAAEHLFAASGIGAVATREIVEAAEQRNVSAVSYHFGSREGLLLAVLARRGAPVDAERGRRRQRLIGRPSTRDLIDCLVGPYCDLLSSESGRSYVRIVAQLRGRFASWRVDSDAATTRCLAAILDELESRPRFGDAVRRERVVAMIMLMTAATAERARCLTEGIAPELSHSQFVDNLVDMCTALMER